MVAVYKSDLESEDSSSSTPKRPRKCKLKPPSESIPTPASSESESGDEDSNSVIGRAPTLFKLGLAGSGINSGNNYSFILK